MIKKRDEWKLSLMVQDAFGTSIRDAYTCDIEGVFDCEQLKDEVSSMFAPQEVYNEDRLSFWAEENGYVKEAGE